MAFAEGTRASAGCALLLLFCCALPAVTRPVVAVASTFSLTKPPERIQSVHDRARAGVFARSGAPSSVVAIDAAIENAIARTRLPSAGQDDAMKHHIHGAAGPGASTGGSDSDRVLGRSKPEVAPFAAPRALIISVRHGGADPGQELAISRGDERVAVGNERMVQVVDGGGAVLDMNIRGKLSGRNRLALPPRIRLEFEPTLDVDSAIVLVRLNLQMVNCYGRLEEHRVVTTVRVLLGVWALLSASEPSRRPPDRNVVSSSDACAGGTKIYIKVDEARL